MSESNGHGLKSLDTALGVLAHMATLNGPSQLSDIAKACRMPPSKAHRYLASFVSAGLVRQVERSGRYDLGPAAMQLGLASLARHDFVNSAADGLPTLAAETGMTVLLSVWANQGATVVRWERGTTPTDTSMGLGTTLPLLNSATGRVFLVWGPQRATAKALETQVKRFAKQPGLSGDFEPTKAGIKALADNTRQRGFACVDGRFIPGLVAAAAPVLDWQGEAQAAITLVGIDPASVAPGSPQTQSLLDYCSRKSVRRPISPNE